MHGEPLENIEADEAFNPDVLEKLAGRATRITVADGASMEVPLRRIKVVDIVR
jgi:hypothetical protein